ncbi:MAG: hypothetical protein KatS3mg068_2672 [Candidatus Sericytochromatia bacterium]|nr:MAG: hypothetical protein KatS3mg068_2672 [Candidatus Sericytochromatia bacterium]
MGYRRHIRIRERMRMKEEQDKDIDEFIKDILDAELNEAEQENTEINEEKKPSLIKCILMILGAGLLVYFCVGFIYAFISSLF